MEARIDGAIVLVGFMGAGKSTGARAIAAELGGTAVDSDRELELALGEPIEAFFDREGEDAYRAREEEMVCELLDRGDAAVIALGGGAVQSERVREALIRHTVVHLDIDPDSAWRRASGKGRPLARDPARFAQLHARPREPLRDGGRRADAAGGARRPAPGPSLRAGAPRRSARHAAPLGGRGIR